MVPFGLALAAQVGFLVHQISVLSDRVNLRKLSAVNIGAQGVALAVMAAWPAPTVLVAASLVFGLGVGNLITFPPLLARAEFGQRSFGTVFGPGLMGLPHDLLGSYQAARWCQVALEAIAAVSVLGGRALRDDG